MKLVVNNSDAGPLPFVLVAIERLGQAIDRETQDLISPGVVDYRLHAQNKSQSLMELSRLEPALSALRGHPRLRKALAELVAKLDANHQLLLAKLRAARAVAEVVARAISEGQSDGTYSAHVWRENRR